MSGGHLCTSRNVQDRTGIEKGGGRVPFSAAGDHTRWQETILGGRRPYSAAGDHTRRQDTILRRRSFLAAGNLTRRQEEIVFSMKLFLTIVTLPAVQKS
jgi:hypothetical protein